MTRLPPCPDSDSCILYLVRHGATNNNLAQPPLLQGCGVNEGLSDIGTSQAERTGKLLADIKMDSVLSSPLRRAQETAEAIAQHHDLKVETLPAIIEVDVGDWEGRSWKEIAKTEPEPYERFMRDPAENGYLGGESLGQVADRVCPAMDEAASARLGQSIAVVAHNVVNRVFLARVMEMPVKRARELNQDNCGVSVLRFRDKKWKLLTLNSTFHL